MMNSNFKGAALLKALLMPYVLKPALQEVNFILLVPSTINEYRIILKKTQP
jgi:hypothetical protein